MRRFHLPSVLILLLSTVLSVTCGSNNFADMALINGKVSTVDTEFSIQESVAVRNGKIIFVGSNDDTQRYIGPGTEVIDLEGNLVLPGLVDGHAHLIDLGIQLASLDINGTKSWQEIIDRVEAEVPNRKPGEWITGGRWDHNKWPDREFPVHDALSAVSPDNPVYLKRHDGNSAFANKKALEIAGITKDTPDPFGGRIMRKPNGEPTGVLVNRAMDLVLKHIPEDTPGRRREKFKLAVDECLKYGFTGVYEAGLDPADFDILKDMIDKNELKMRVYGMLNDPGEMPHDDMVQYFTANRLENYGDNMLSVLSIKVFFDGALGSRGAAFFEPYDDDPAYSGLVRCTPEHIYDLSKAALETGMGVNTHCIGIRGNRWCLDAYIKALNENPVEDHRFRIEHAQIIRPEDLKLFTEYQIIPAMQPTHCTSDMHFIEDRIGIERSKGAYAWRWFIGEGLPVPLGSDFPVEPVNPMFGIYSSVTRRDRDTGWPGGGWNPGQRMTREEAVKGFTIWNAYGAFQENITGSIEVGKLADFTVLDKDILTVPLREIVTAKALYTIVGGKIVYRAN